MSWGLRSFINTLLSGGDFELNGFVDLSVMSAAAGFKLRVKNMTALGVEVLGTFLNKTVLTGDDLWGLPWAGVWCVELEISGLDIGYICLCWQKLYLETYSRNWIKCARF